MIEILSNKEAIGGLIALMYYGTICLGVICLIISSLKDW